MAGLFIQNLSMRDSVVLVIPYIFKEQLSPLYEGDNVTMRACMVGMMSYSCEEEWDVPAKICNGTTMVYLTPTQRCGRYCLNEPGPWFDKSCSTNNVISGNYTRTPSYKSLSYYTCESNSLSSGWYSLEDGWTIHTEHVYEGQCGSNYPIYFQGISPLYEGDNVTIRACMVGMMSYSYMSCEEEWDVPAKRCNGTTMVYLTPTQRCGRYCLNGPDPWLEDSCDTNDVISGNHTRIPNYYSYSYTCESNSLQSGWYSLEDGWTIHTEHVYEGQCGSSYPIYFQGTSPLYEGDNVTMRACMVGMMSYSCEEEWDVPAKICNGTTMIYLTPTQRCGRYCLNEPGPWFDKSCSTNNVISGNYTRTPSYNLLSYYTCESNSLPSGWYSLEDGWTIHTEHVYEGQCGSSYPIYFQGISPLYEGDNVTMRACMVGMMSYSYMTYCEEEWDVPAKRCNGTTMVYLTPTQRCGRYCLNEPGPWFDKSCSTDNVISGNYTRTPSYKSLNYYTCESNSLPSGWYSLEDGWTIHTEHVYEGQCGSSYPIYFRGISPLYEGDNVTMRACMVGMMSYSYMTYCEEEWDVPAKRCNGTTMVYLTPTQRCGRYCLNGPDPWLDDSCETNDVISGNHTRIPSYYSYSYTCESNSLPSGWYSLEDGWTIHTEHVYEGQCGSSYPIYFQGTSPLYEGDNVTMRACMVGMMSYSCEEEWDVPAKICNGTTMIYLTPTQRCGRYCLNEPGPWFDKSCSTDNVISGNYTRTPSYNLLSYYTCESNSLPSGWYSLEDGWTIHTEHVYEGQCGSSYPIYFQGISPLYEGDNVTMRACMVGMMSYSYMTYCEEEWDVPAKRCNGTTMVYLTPTQRCGRYCLNEPGPWFDKSCSTDNVISGNYTRTPSYKSLNYYTCESNSLPSGWYSLEDGWTIHTEHVYEGQCGSSYPIYFRGISPLYEGDNVTMRACMVGMMSYSYMTYCEEEWDVPAKRCNGTTMVYLTPTQRCGRYCLNGPDPWLDDSCDTNDVISGNHTRIPSYYSYSYTCESNSLPSGWYSLEDGWTIHTEHVYEGQCGSSYPIYFQGTNPLYEGDNVTMRACMVGMMSYSCEEEWDVPAKICNGTTMIYLTPTQRCGRYCLNEPGPWFDKSCSTNNVISGNYTRTPSYNLLSYYTCESNSLPSGWYSLEDGWTIHTEHVYEGQCGSSYPIYFQGISPLYEGDNVTMRACMVGMMSYSYMTYCEEEWDVPAKRCNGTTMVYLTPTQRCGRYCLNEPGPWFDKSCSTDNVISGNYTRTPSYKSLNYYTCESNSLPSGWYSLEDGWTIHTEHVYEGQCGSSYPIYFRGISPLYEGDNVTMRACMVGMMSYSYMTYCEEEWDVPAKRCNGTTMVYLTPTQRCGRYCLNGPDPWLDDSCDTNDVISGNHTRIPSYYSYSYTCESNSLPSGWYSLEDGWTIHTEHVYEGKCGSSYPIYFQGTSPLYEGDNVTMRACMVGMMSNSCEEEWDVPAKICNGTTMIYLTPTQRCGRYCLNEPGPWFDKSCSTNNVISGNYTRTPSYNLLSYYTCESNSLPSGWYSLEDGWTIHTEHVYEGQCGSSYPIYFQGISPLYEGDNVTMRACMVGMMSYSYMTYCEEEWDVPAKRCNGTTMVYLTPTQRCGRYCLNGPDPWLDDSCETNDVISGNHTRIPSYYSYSYTCESNSLPSGWYSLEDGWTIHTEHVYEGQCGSSYPIYFQGTSPLYEGDNVTMRACMVGMMSYSCEEEWDVPAKICNGTTMIYLTPTQRCGHYCLNEPGPWFDKSCSTDNVISGNYTRTPSYNLLSYYTCESNSLPSGWYSLEDGWTIHTEHVYEGQCGSSYPIYFQGISPLYEGDNVTMRACMVGMMSYSYMTYCEEEWDVPAKRCNGTTMVYLTPTQRCGRYCLNEPGPWFDKSCSTDNVISGNYTRTPSYKSLNYYTCESNSLPSGWYSLEDGWTIHTEHVYEGQCGSSYPIYFRGISPLYEGDNVTMRACMVGMMSYSYMTYCEEEWDVPAKRCNGTTMVYLTPTQRCGRYCLNGPDPWLDDSCETNDVISGNHTRIPSYYSYSYTCESNSLPSGWYSLEDGWTIHTEHVYEGQCGSSYPIYFQGTNPLYEGDNITMTACMVGMMSYSCEEEWDVPAKICNGTTMIYLTPTQRCGRYCLNEPGPWFDKSCSTNNVISGNYTRTPSYNLLSYYTCESNSLPSGWYSLEDGWTIHTEHVYEGQCGSSYPIYFQGISPLYEGDNVTMRACMVGIMSYSYMTYCEEEWDVPAKRCNGTTMVYLTPTQRCGRYCLNEPGPWFDKSCSTDNVISGNYTRTPSYKSLNYYTCESNSLPSGWYSLEDGWTIHTEHVYEGQCGSSYPIYFRGISPLYEGDNVTMRACMVGMMSYSYMTYCEEEWDVPAKRCNGTTMVYLTPTQRCGRYCLNGPDPWLDDSCDTNDVISGNHTRIPSYYSYSYTCESNSLPSGWYSLEDGWTIHTEHVYEGQCGSRYPIYFQGTSPLYEGDNVTMRACMVGMMSYSCEEEWDVPAKICNGTTMIYLTPTQRCGRYCLNEPSPWFDKSCSTDNVISGNYTRTPSYNLLSYYTCESNSLPSGWYSLEDGWTIHTEHVYEGQCGSSYPIYFQGISPLYEGDNVTMRACMVGMMSYSYMTYCEEEWDVPAKRCNGTTMVYLTPTQRCGRYCLNEPGPWFDKSCSTDNYISGNYTRTPSYKSLNYYTCESNSLPTGWYSLEDGWTIHTEHVYEGQCGSSYPIYFRGISPLYEGDNVTMRACMVGMMSYSYMTYCEEEWDVPAKRCNGTTMVYLTPTQRCGRYCLNGPDPWLEDSCDTNDVISGNHTRIPSYYSYSYTCESNSLPSGWYSLEDGWTIHTEHVYEGQCGSSYPIYFQGTSPLYEGDNVTMRACMVGMMSYSYMCEEEWDVPAKICNGTTMVYLTPTQRCGRYCLNEPGPWFDKSCSTNNVISGNYTRTPSYNSLSYYTCESNGLPTGWYSLEDGWTIHTEHVYEGQCGSSYPIYFQGISPLYEGDNVTMRACMVGMMSYSYMSCEEEWDVPAKRCNGTTMVYLTPTQRCGRYCLNEPGPWFDKSCSTDNVISGNYTRSPSYKSLSYYTCESNSLPSGWYSLEEGWTIHTEHVYEGQCGSSYPIYFRGISPLYEGDNVTMRACMVGMMSYSYMSCEEEWDVPAKRCNGTTMVYLTPTQRCGRYCLNGPDPWLEDSCDTNDVISGNHTRIPSYYSYSYTCESNSLPSGWYSLEDGWTIHTEHVFEGQCGSSYPIYFQGTSPLYEGDNVTMRACMVGMMSYSYMCEEEWDVPAKICNGTTMVYLTPTQRCGRYCLNEPGPWFDKSCSTNNVISGNYTRTPSYNSLSYYTCESNSLPTGWYSLEDGWTIHTEHVYEGQCGSSYPIYFQGISPLYEGDNVTMRACMVGMMSYSYMSCEEEWDVPAKRCNGTTMVYLTPTQRCGRYCLNEPGPWFDKSCSTDNVISGNYTRTPSYKSLSYYTCESNSLPLGWYSLEEGWTIHTEHVYEGQCGSSYPIYFRGISPLYEGDNVTMRACMVGMMSYSYMSCEEEWDVPAKRCNGTTMVYLTPTQRCGRYCLNGPDPWLEDSCDTNDVISGNHTRIPSYYSYSYTCESNSLPSGWYSLEDGWTIHTEHVFEGQCGSSYPIYFQGTSPLYEGDNVTMRACMVGMMSYSYMCEEEWDVPAKICNGTTMVYLTPTQRCGRYCLNEPGPWFDKSCSTNNVISGNYTRTPSYNSLSYYTCESNSLPTGWYSLEDGWTIHTEHVYEGQCGSSYPIYFQGISPLYEGDNVTMRACMVGMMSYSYMSCEEEWDVPAKRCNGTTMVYLTPTQRCGRYCLNEPGPWFDKSCSTDNVISGNYTRSPSYKSLSYYTCESNSLPSGWYSLEEGWTIHTEHVYEGQCGSSYPIYFRGISPLYEGDNVTMRACMVGMMSYSYMSCEEEWDVPAKRCNGTTMVYLTPTQRCGHYCLNGPDPWLEDSCDTNDVISGNHTRIPRYYSYSYTCESNSLPSGWYSLEDGWTIHTEHVFEGQCGSSYPIYFQGTSPLYEGDNVTMRACMVGMMSYSYMCEEEWDVPAKICNGTTMVYLTPTQRCGRYCLNEPGPWFDKSCSTNNVISGNYTRTPSYNSLSYYTCESNSLPTGWYSLEDGWTIHTEHVYEGQCGSSYPIYFQGISPLYEGDNVTMRACMVGMMSYSYMSCEEEWDVPAKRCNGTTMVYLTPTQRCGRYCLNEPGPWFDKSCSTDNVISGNYTRSPSYKSLSYYTCESNSLPSGWYSLEEGWTIHTEHVYEGQCGSSYPIYFRGISPLYEGDNVTMRACMVGMMSYSYMSCEEEWDVPAKRCNGTTMVYLTPTQRCGRYCLNGPDPWLEDSCDTNDVISGNHTRIPRYYSYSYTCESNSLPSGWYSLEDGWTIHTEHVFEGQCGSSYPIYFQGTSPLYEGDNVTMRACMVGMMSYSYMCEEEWDVPAKICNGTTMVYLTPTQRCGRYCLNEPGPWIDKSCSSTNVISGNYTRTPSYNSLSYYTCESNSLPTGWYSLEDGWTIHTEHVYEGQCGSNYPIYFQGISPLYEGDNVTMRACMVGMMSYSYMSCEEEWDVPAKRCNGTTMVYLTPTQRCGRYCLNEPGPWFDKSCSTDNVISGNYTRSPSYKSLSYYTCESNSLPSGWYSLEEGWTIHTEHVYEGQCGSSYPIYFRGISPLYEGDNVTMRACMVGMMSYSYMSCEEEWDVPAKRCNGTSMVYLTPTQRCGRYCLNGPDPWLEDSCDTNDVLSGNHTRIPSYYSYSYTCESNSLPSGWYSLEDGWTIHTEHVFEGQCGSSYPIYFQGTSPLYEGDNVTMRACMVGMMSYSYMCEEEWDVPAKICNGTTMVYLTPTQRCGRYCLNEPGPWFDKSCSTNNVISGNYTRIPSYNSLSYYTCESNSLPTGWYSLEDGWTIHTEHVYEGQCGSNYPIYFQGTSPLYEGDNVTMRACMVGMMSYSYMSCEEEWDVPAKRCNGTTMVYLTPTQRCGRYCLNNESQVESDTYSSTTYSLFSSSSSHDFELSSVKSSIPLISATEELATLTTTLSLNTRLNDKMVTSLRNMTSINSDESIVITPTKINVSPSSSTMGFSATSPDYKMVSSATSLYEEINIDSTQTNSEIVTELLSLSGSVVQKSTILSSSIDLVTVASSSAAEAIMKTSTTNTDTTPLLGIQSDMYLIQSSSSLPVSSSMGMVMSSKSEDVSPTDEISSSTLSRPIAVDTVSTESTVVASSMSFSSAEFNMAPTSSALDTGTSVSPELDINLADFIYVYAQTDTSTIDTTTADRQLTFQCYYYNSYMYNNDFSILNNYYFDVLWEIDDEEIVTKYNMPLSEVTSNGKIRSSEWTSKGISMGFNINCGIRFSLNQAIANVSYVMGYSDYFVGMEVWPKFLDISSGESAMVWVWTTVPVSCTGENNIDSCKLVVEMFDFNEQFTSGSPAYCNESITELTKPSLCGLELDGWQTPWSWQSLHINLPENTAQDQSYKAKLQLRVSDASDDPIWFNYILPEITINVVNDNITDDFWWWYGDCSTGTDPWFSTFDWKWYGFHDEGEFVLYRHKTKPIEVHTIQRRYESDHDWTENCAIAIRAASDVFIIYGCGRPTKWIVRREGCDVGNEYLEVYSRWGGYEVVLPTGSRVHVWISLNRRLNAFITLSRTERYNTEGLCGTWNRNYTDDYTGRDGVIYEDSNDFARTWSVPASDSLFIAKERTEKLSQSFMYCTCLGDTLDKLSPNVDCSWKESLPVCPPLYWGKESCTVRKKRSTDTDDDESVIDVPPDMVAYTRKPEVSMDWKNGWTEATATDACNLYFNESVLFSACSSLSNVNTTAAINTCVFNIQLSGTDEYNADAFEMFKTQCTNEVRTNNTLWTTTSDEGGVLAEIISENNCPFDCKYNGKRLGDCVNGNCSCYAGYTGDDCRVDTVSPPSTVTAISEDSKCDTATRSCSYMSVYGENFYESENLKCRLEKAELINNDFIKNGTTWITNGNLENLGEVKCPTNMAPRRKKRSTVSLVSPSYYLVSVSTNGINYSEPVPMILFDSSCTTCSTISSIVTCTLRTDVCVVDGMCYPSTSSVCVTASSDSTEKKLWIIGVVISVLLSIIVVLVLIKLCRPSKPISPLQSSDDLSEWGLTSCTTEGSRMAKPNIINSKTKRIEVLPLTLR